MASKIISVDEGSPAARAGLAAGETLLQIDGTAIRDVLDYKFYSYDARLTLKVLEQDGETVREVRVRKREGEPLGLNFEHYLMDQMKQCSNKCVFCFIDQLPKGMRKTLYVKDDDARMSFLMGNYISMTNLSEADVDRILRMHISPVNISVQTTNPELRVKMLQNRRAGEALKIMDRFAEGGITMNCQLVVCKGLNDGDELKRSLHDLKKLYPAVNTISVVPFGMTRHREGLYPLEPTDKPAAEAILDIVEPFAEQCLRELGTRLVWCGDELYLKAERPLPDTAYYEDFTQFENGIGMLPLFMEEFRLALPDYAGRTARPFTIATGAAAGPSLAVLLDEAAAKCDNLKGKVVTIRNDFLRRTGFSRRPDHRAGPGRTTQAGCDLGEVACSFPLTCCATAAMCFWTTIPRSRCRTPSAFRLCRSRSTAQTCWRRYLKTDPVISEGGNPICQTDCGHRRTAERRQKPAVQPTGGQAPVHCEDTLGVTRDRLYAESDWRGRDFTIIDTGGIEPNNDNEILQFMRFQAETAISHADVIIFITDLRTGITAADQDVAAMLLRSGKPIVLAVNKCDKPGAPEPEFYEFYNLGLGEPYGISALHGYGVGELLDAAYEHFPPADEDEEKEERIRVALIGKPNVGKSSLLNRVLGEERVIVSNVAGTTRDSVDADLDNVHGKFTFIDTAGIRKKSKVDEKIEKYSVMRSLLAVERADVCVIMIDATEGVTEQDTKVAGEAHNAGKACIIVVNKWDLVEKDGSTMKEYTLRVREGLAYMPYAPVLFISAQTGQRVDKLFALIKEVYEQNHMRIPTGRLNSILAEATARVQPPTDKGRRLRIFYMTQASTCPPTFVCFCNDARLFHFSYQRYLENQIREVFGLTGTPVRMVIRERGDKK